MAVPALRDWPDGMIEFLTALRMAQATAHLKGTPFQRAMFLLRSAIRYRTWNGERVGMAATDEECWIVARRAFDRWREAGKPRGEALLAALGVRE